MHFSSDDWQQGSPTGIYFHENFRILECQLFVRVDVSIFTQSRIMKLLETRTQERTRPNEM